MAGNTAVLLLIMLTVYMKSVECYPHKRDVNSLPQVITLLSEGRHMQTTQTQLLENITATSVATLPQIVTLLDKYSQHLQNITDALNMLNAGKIAASLQKLTKGFPFTARDCSDIAAQGPYRNGPYTITPWDELGSFKAQCDMTTDAGTGAGGWTVFQKRFDGSVDFYRNWEDYKNGFGNIDGEYWLGLEKLNRLTSTRDTWQLRVELEDFDGNTGYAQYDNFRIGDETSSFQLNIGAYSGTAGDSLTYHANMAFTTRDKDNDLSSGNNAVSYKAAWWFKNGYYSSLNGLYLGSPQVTNTGMNWYHFTGNTHETLKRSEMKIRPVY